MKKRLVLLMSLCLLLALTACGKDKNKENNSGLTAVNPGTEISAEEDGSSAGSEDGYFSGEYGEYFVGGITYTLDAATKTAAATGVYSLENTDVVMPDVIAYEGTEYKVTSAAESLLAYQESLTGVKLAAGLTEIPASMFYGCENLTKVVIPEGVKVIGDNAFTQCFSLMEITLPNGLEKIGEEAFFACEMLQKVVLPDSVKEVGNAAFYDCSLLKIGRAHV